MSWVPFERSSALAVHKDQIGGVCAERASASAICAGWGICGLGPAFMDLRGLARAQQCDCLSNDNGRKQRLEQ